MISRQLIASAACAVLIVALGIYRFQPVMPADAAHPSTPNTISLIYLPLVTNQVVPGVPVSMQNIAYHPQAIQVHVGTRVVWTNNEMNSFIEHTATSGTPGMPSGTFDSPLLGQGQSFPFTFTSTGTFAYYCRVHGSAMTGVVTVVP